MKPGICFKNIWLDDNVIELNIITNDGNSSFTNNVYVGYQELDDLINGLVIFKDHVYGGLYNINFGEFGPEYANGAFSARLHFQEGVKIYISVRIQSDFSDFGVKGYGLKNVASEAILYLISEPALLDNFISELKLIKTLDNNACLECVER